MNLAVLDLGSNSFHLAVFTSSDRAVLAPRRELRSAVQLGASLRNGHIEAEGFARGLRAIETLLSDLSGVHPGCPVVAVATSAIRDAINGRGFCEEVGRRHGVSIEILSGRDEARMAFLGARLFAGPAGRLAVVDLGGGSLEVASGPGADPDVAESIPLGVLRLRDVHLRPGSTLDPQARDRVAAAVRFAAADAARAVWNRHPERLAFTSGTARTLGTLADELGMRGTGSGELTREVLARLVQVLCQFRPVDLPALGVDQSRSDTIAIGAVVLQTMMELLGFDRALVSPLALREGVAIRELRRRPRTEVHAAVT